MARASFPPFYHLRVPKQVWICWQSFLKPSSSLSLSCASNLLTIFPGHWDGELSLSLSLSHHTLFHPPSFLPWLPLSLSSFPYFLFLGSLATKRENWHYLIICTPSTELSHLLCHWLSNYLKSVSHSLILCSWPTIDVKGVLSAEEWGPILYVWNGLVCSRLVYPRESQTNKKKSLIRLSTFRSVVMFPSKAEVGDWTGKKNLVEYSQTDCSELALKVKDERFLRSAWCYLARFSLASCTLIFNDSVHIFSILKVMGIKARYSHIFILMGIIWALQNWSIVGYTVDKADDRKAVWTMLWAPFCHTCTLSA